ncbi:MAG: hypothetical protein K9H16_01670 [Bacteroidales bacterium]|nr:hypothetical protein [Bacteroidales bacterium]
MDQTNDRNKRTTKNFTIIFLNSLSYFIIAFIFMYMLGQLATAVAALQFDYSSIIYYYKLIYTIDSGAWTSDSVKLLYSLAPLLSLLTGIIFLIIFIRIYDHLAYYKIFFLWCFAYAVIWSFGALLAGTILDKGIGYVVMYFYLLDTGKLIISLFSLTMMLIISTLTTKWFLFSANSYFNELNEHNRAFFTFAHILLPLLVGTAIMIVVKLPQIRYYELFILLLGLIFGVPVLLRYSSYPTFFFDEFPIRIKLDKYAFFIAIILLIAFRLILHFGIKFTAAS